MANESKRMSTQGLVALRLREGIARRYYNDIANNCTFGIGALVHLGPCTADELRRPVADEQINTQLRIAVQSAEAAVRRRVPDAELTQAQFDSLVSLTFNVGPTGARRTLDAANSGDNNAVIDHMRQNVFIHSRNAQGQRRAPVRVPGLVNRRIEESAPFRGDGL